MSEITDLRMRFDTLDHRTMRLEDGRPVLALIGGGHGNPFTQEEKRVITSRVVACWNACQGLHTESLERGEPLAQQLVDALNRAHRAAQQRDELLAALRANHQWHLDYDETGTYAGSELEAQNLAAIDRAGATP